MIQAFLLIALGFLSASLIGVLVAPSLWSRAYRLSRKRLEQTLPITLSEIEATQDQLKASYAVRMRRLETALASAKQKAAMQLVDNSRLQMQIGALKDEIADLDLKLSERRNAATVLEQTITQRLPELDREISVHKQQLIERSYDIQDLTNKLSRRNEELDATGRMAASHQDELTRLQQALEKNSADRTGRRLRRASQWNLEDYRAEYDRLNLELSKLRQQLARLQDRDVQQGTIIKEELQKLAELILASAQPKSGTLPAERPEPATKRAAGSEIRRDRPQPWPEKVPPPLAALAPAPDDLEGSPQDPETPAAEAPLQAPASHADKSSPRSRLLREAVPGKLSRRERQEDGAPEDASESPKDHAEPGLNGSAPSSGHGPLGDGARWLQPKAAAPETADGPVSGEASKELDAEGKPRSGLETAAPKPVAAVLDSSGTSLLDRLRGVGGETAEADK